MDTIKMEKTVTWRIFSTYLLIILFILFAGTAFGQIKVTLEKIEDKLYNR